jgi:hypothetical protein
MEQQFFDFCFNIRDPAEVDQRQTFEIDAVKEQIVGTGDISYINLVGNRGKVETAEEQTAEALREKYRKRDRPKRTSQKKSVGRAFGMFVFQFLINHNVSVFVGVNAVFAVFFNVDAVPADVDRIAVLAVNINALLV